jgi:hypothetical protein
MEEKTSNNLVPQEVTIPEIKDLLKPEFILDTKPSDGIPK